MRKAKQQHNKQPVSADAQYQALVNFFNQASLCLAQGKLEEARKNYLQVLALKPDLAEAHNNLGVVLQHLGKPNEAVEHHKQAIRFKPDYAQAFQNLGLAFKALDKPLDALENYQQAILLEPLNPDLHLNLGLLLSEQPEGFEQAINRLQHALKLNPNLVEAYISLGAIYKEQEKLDTALAMYQQALAIKPDYSEAYFSLASLFHYQGKIELALENYQKILQITPDYPAARYNLGTLLLSLGQMQEGWQYYEARYDARMKDSHMLAPEVKYPQWQGASLQGKSVLVWGEQGFGDEIQFCRYAAELKSRGASRISWVCRKPLKQLFTTLQAVDNLFVRADAGKIPSHDYWVFALSIPLHCKTTLNNIPATTPYLFANPKLVKTISVELAAVTEFKVGICWKGRPTYKNDKTRSPGIRWFNPVFNLPGVKFVTLQPDTRAEFLAAAGAAGIDRGHEIDESSFEEAAALIMNVDLVITSDTSICHLAGALGKPVWLLLQFKPDWRWFSEREDSPWYPKMRLFRQSQAGNWQQVFQRVETELKQMLAGETS